MELAKAYVQIIPSAQGMQGSIASAMNGESSSAGESSGKSFASSFGGMAKKAIVGLGIGKIITDGINNASEFETAMAKTSTLFSGSAEEFDALQNQILNLSSQYGLSATMLAEAAYSAESASVPMEQLGPMLEGSAKLALAGFTDIDTALSATAKTMNAYGDAAMSAEDIQKVLIQTQNLGITTVGELGASLANVTPTAAAMGVGFDQVGAALAQMTAQGVPTAQATTQLRSAMTELGKAGTKADTAFRAATEGTKYAGMGFKEAMAAGASLGDVFGMMQTYADASGVSMVDLWGSVEAGNAAMMIASDVDKFNSNLQQMATDSDVVGEAYGKMADTFGTDLNRLKESATNFMTTLFQGGDISGSFDSLLSSLGDVGERLIGWITTGVSNLAENLPSIMSSLLDFGGSLLEALGKVDWPTLGTTIINGIVGALGELGTRLATLAGEAVSAVVNGDVDFTQLGGAILGGFGTVLDSIGTLASNILTAFTDVLCPGGENAFAAIFTDGENQINTIDWEQLGTNVASAGAALVNLTGEALAGGFTAAENIISTINWENLGQTVGTVANGLVNLTGDVLAAGFTAAESLINTINWEGLGETVGTAANGLVNLTGDVLAAGFTAAESLISGIDWAGIGETVASVANGLTTLTGDALAGAFTSAEALIKGIDWEGIGTTAAGAANGLISLTGDTLSGAFTAAHATIAAINWEGLGTTVGNVANKLVEYSGEALAAPFQAAHDILTAINWSEVGTAMQTGIGDVWSGLTGFLGGVLGGAGDAVQGIGTGIGSAAEGIGDAIHNLFSGDDAKQSAEELKKTMADLEKAISDGESKIKETSKGIGSSIREAIEAELSATQMNTIGTNAITNLETGLNTGESSLPTAMSVLAAAAVSGFGANWAGVGQNVVTGIISGIRSNTSLLVAAMTELAQAALQAIKSKLKVGSPSRVMEDEVGRWIPAGIATGIAENGSLVEDAMNSLAFTAAGSNIGSTLAAQESSFGSVARDSVTESIDAGILGQIINAVREGIQDANIALYMDGQKVSERVNEYMGEEIAVRRFA